MLPAAALARRWGLGKLLFVFFAAVGAISAVRVLVTGAAPLLALAFLSGAVFPCTRFRWRPPSRG